MGEPFTADTAGDIEEITNVVVGGRRPVENHAQIERALRQWTMREPGDIRQLTKLTRANPEYLSRLHSTLRKQYEDEIIVFRGGGLYWTGGRPIKGALSVTTDRDIAARFGRVSQFSIETDKVLAAIPTMESELIAYVSDLKAIPCLTNDRAERELRRKLLGL